MMSPDTHGNEIEAAASDLVACLVRRNQQASIHLARLILIDRADEGCAYRLFARALAQQVRQRQDTCQVIQEDDVIRMLRSAASKLISEDWED